MTTILSIDPGNSSGIALGDYTDHTPYKLRQVWQVPGGVRAFVEWWLTSSYSPLNNEVDIIVAEKFILSSGNDFTAALDAAQIEGALAMAWDGPLVYQLRSEKRSVTNQDIERGGYKVTAVQVAQPDANDAMDAIRHALIYLRSIGHVPTLKKVYGGSE